MTCAASVCVGEGPQDSSSSPTKPVTVAVEDALNMQAVTCWMCLYICFKLLYCDARIPSSTTNEKQQLSELISSLCDTLCRLVLHKCPCLPSHFDLTSSRPSIVSLAWCGELPEGLRATSKTTLAVRYAQPSGPVEPCEHLFGYRQSLLQLSCSVARVRTKLHQLQLPSALS
jgi:hypothetical protein